MLKILKRAKGQSDKCQLYQEAVTMVMTRGVWRHTSWNVLL